MEPKKEKKRQTKTFHKNNINKIYRFCRRQSYMHIDTKTVHTCFCTHFQCPKAFAMSVILFKQKLNTLTHFTFKKKKMNEDGKRNNIACQQNIINMNQTR